MFATAEHTDNRVKLFRELQKALIKFGAGLLLISGGRPRSPNRIQHISLRAAFTVGHHYHQKGPSNRTPPLDPGPGPYCTSLRLRSQHAWRVVQAPAEAEDRRA